LKVVAVVVLVVTVFELLLSSCVLLHCLMQLQLIVNFWSIVQWIC